MLFQHLLSIYPNLKMMLFLTLTKERKQSGFWKMAEIQFRQHMKPDAMSEHVNFPLCHIYFNNFLRSNVNSFQQII